MTVLECMICGSRRHVLREEKVCLCTRCLAAIAGALGEKLGEGERGSDKTLSSRV